MKNARWVGPDEVSIGTHVYGWADQSHQLDKLEDPNKAVRWRDEQGHLHWRITELNVFANGVVTGRAMQVSSKGRDHGLTSLGRMTGYWWLIIDDGPSTSPVATHNGMWNGTCTKCGARTYTGFISTEHEGPCAR